MKTASKNGNEEKRQSHVNTLKQILQETTQIYKEDGRMSEVKYRDHPAMVQRFR